MGVDQTDRVQRIMMATQNAGIVTVDELSSVLAQVTPTAAAMGVSFENIGASLATMTAAGVPAAQATTNLNQMIAELGKNGTTASKALAKAVEGTKYSGMYFQQMMDAGVPLNEVLDLMGGYADKSGKSMLDMFSSIEAGKAALSISGQNSAQFAKNLEYMGTSADLVGDAYDKMMDTLTNQVGKLKESAKNVGILLYQNVETPLRDLAKFGNEVLADISATIQEDGLAGLGKAFGDALGQVTARLASYAPDLVKSAIDLIGAMVEGIVANSDSVVTSVMNMLAAVVDGIGNLLPRLVESGAKLAISLATGLAQKLPQIAFTLVKSLSTLASKIDEYAPQIAEAGKFLLDNLQIGIEKALRR
jgi:hypothetical protein